MTIPGCAACGRQELPDWPPAHRAVMAAVVRRCIGNGGAAWGAFGRDSGAMVGLCALDGQLPHPPSPWIFVQGLDRSTHHRLPGYQCYGVFPMAEVLAGPGPRACMVRAGSWSASARTSWTWPSSSPAARTAARGSASSSSRGRRPRRGRSARGGCTSRRPTRCAEAARLTVMSSSPHPALLYKSRKSL
jgi:hypothetical protein